MFLTPRIFLTPLEKGADSLNNFPPPPAINGRRFLVRPSDLLPWHCCHHSSGPLSPSVSRTRSFAGSRMPSGTLQGFRQNVQGSIVVSIHHQATMRTDMRAHAERFVHPLATPRAILCGEV